MIERTAYHMELKGSNYEIGQALGNIALSVPELADMQRLPGPVLSKEEQTKMFGLFDRFCPGINEEVAAFAEVLKLPAGQVFYYLMSYLRPGCSQMVVLPSKTMDGHLWLARNYDFSDQYEEMTLYTTRVKGKYAHIGSSSLQFGRGDGMNEHGLAVSQSSAGFPVGNMEFARKPAITGLQYWAVIRSVLENCRDVDDAVNLTKEMPIACNMNLLVADRSGNAALIESFDGHKALKRINADTEEQFICATNHLHLPELKHHDPDSMENSIHRYELITGALSSKDKLKKEDLKGILSKKYPEGLCSHYYDQFFGTLRSIVFDVTDGTAEICFGSPALNGWHTFRIEDEVKQNIYPVKLEKEQADPDIQH